MKILKKLASFSAALLVSLSSLFVLGAPRLFAATATWTGGGADTNMNNAGNWGGTAPSAGDDLVFPVNITNRTVVNNYTAGTSFNSITFSGATTQPSSYTVSGNSLTVVAGITSSMTGSSYALHTFGAPLTLGGNQTFTVPDGTFNITSSLNLSTYNLVLNTGSYLNITGNLSGSGTLTKSGTNALTLSGDNSAYTGAIIVTAGTLYASSQKALATSGGTSVNANTDLVIGACDTPIFNGNITLTGVSTSPTGQYIQPKLSIANYECGSGTGAGGGGDSDPEVTYKTYGISAGTNNVTFTGNITLGSDITYASYGKSTTLTGALSGAHKINLLEGYGGVLTVSGSANSTSTPNGTYTPSAITNTLTDALPKEVVFIGGSSLITINGTRSDVDVNGSLATLKGTGTLKTLGLTNGAKVAPGNSPGTLTVTELLSFDTSSVYEAEIKNASEFDQIKAGSVNLAITPASPAVLSVTLVDGYGVKAADTFKIIDNTGTAGVEGTFKDLAEGATFKVGDGVFKITYKGGNGNDVVLSVVTVPSVGNTGFKLLASSPYAILAATFAVTASAYVLSRRYAYAKTK